MFWMLSENLISRIWLLSEYVWLFWRNVEIFDDCRIVLFLFVLWDRPSWLFKGCRKLLWILLPRPFWPSVAWRLDTGAPACSPHTQSRNLKIQILHALWYQKFYVVYTLADVHDWNPLIKAFEFWKIEKSVFLRRNQNKKLDLVI